MNPTISNLEQEQLLQTIEMFELITQSNPDDYQSFDILKDAYEKVGREADARLVARKLGQVYLDMGQYSSALLEFEGILQRNPEASDIAALLKDVQEKMARNMSPINSQETGLTATVLKEGRETREPRIPMTTPTTRKVKISPSLMEVNGTQRPRNTTRRISSNPEDGDSAFAKFLIYHGLCPDKAVRNALSKIKERNATRNPGTLPSALIEEVCLEGEIQIEDIYCNLLDKLKLAYIPLELYDIDRQIVRMLPEELTIGKLILPFDLMSRTLMIALANPFDSATKAAAQKALDYNIQWYIASPQAISRSLTEVYRLESVRT